MSLFEHLNCYFTDVNTDVWDWVHDTFSPAVAENGKAEEQLLVLLCDLALKARFHQASHVSLSNYCHGLLRLCKYCSPLPM